MATEIPETKLNVDKAFGYVVATINKHGQPAHIKVGAHIRHITNGRINSLGVYHAAADIPETEKQETYKLVFNALIAKGGPDYSRLCGGVAEQPKPVAPQATPPKRTVKPKAAEDESRIDPMEMAAAEVAEADSALAAIEAPAPTRQREVTADAGADDLTKAIIAAVSKHIHVKADANLDEKRVEELARSIVAEFSADLDKEFHDRVGKANKNGAFPMDRVQELLDKAKEEIAKSLGESMVKRIEFVNERGESKAVEGMVHPQVTQLATWLRAGVPVWAWSAAGSGKTHSARQIAVILEVEPYVISVDPTLTVSKLLGYRNVANGDYVEGFIYKAFKDGGLVALDEIDTGDPGVIASCNALLSNTHYLFPNGETVARHPKFHVLAMANSCGMGATAGYVARNRLDAATLDRFALIEFKWDAMLTRSLCGATQAGQAELWKPGKPAEQSVIDAYVAWYERVQKHVGSSVLVSPRAAINGCKALRAGVPTKEVIDALVLKLCTPDTVTRIKDSCPLDSILSSGVV